MNRLFDAISKPSVIFLRLALGVTFLSAVADRFGLWGGPGENLVAWGNFKNFLDYTALLNPYFPSIMVPVIGWIVTIAEIALGVALIIGFRVRETALISGTLLLCFAIGMTAGIGIKSPLDYSVFTASAGALFLSAHTGIPAKN
ncbi:MAG: DoxX protein [Bacteroidetes bacterium]|nr:DoxX protein [Bacteroidota bacterium]